MTAAEESRPLRMASGSLRYMDETGMDWTVTERDGREVPGSRGARCLIFASAEAVRRVWDFPPGWRDLLTPSLIALSWTR